MTSQRLKEFLDQHRVQFITISHSLAFTALDIAKSAHISSKDMAKTVVITIGNKNAMVVVPAHYKVKLDDISNAIGQTVTLADESTFSRLFPDCEIGAMPPFGNLYDLEVYVADNVTERDSIAFNAGSHSEVIKMTYRDYEALVKPQMILLT